MKSSKKPWPLRSIHGIQERINTNPDFQRPAVWSRAQKQLLVDTVLRKRSKNGVLPIDSFSE